MFRKRICICTLLVTAILVMGFGSTWASVVYDGITNKPSDGVEPIVPGNRLAQEFTTNTSPLGLDSVTLLMDGAGKAEVSIFTNNNSGADVPGSLVGTLVSPASYNSSVLTGTVFTASGLVLNLHTTYWVVMNVPTGAFNWSYARFENSPVLYDTTKYGAWYNDPPNSFLNNSNWINLTDFTAPLQMTINASNAVPEPSTYVLLVIALGAVGFARKKMNRREG